MNLPWAPALLAWLLLLALAVANAVVREKFTLPRLGELRAHQLHTLAYVLGLQLPVTAWFVRAHGLGGASALLLGVFWALLTFGFECFMVRVLARRPWSAVWADYDLARGRLWPLVLLGLLLGPLLCAS